MISDQALIIAFYGFIGSEGRVDYALEGVIVSCGATLEWMKNELGLFNDIAETEVMANSVENNNGVYVIPAFSGLGAPYWQMDRKGAVVGLTFDCNKNHVVRAALESIGYQIKDVINAMQADAGRLLNELMIHGGITSNKFVLQFIADLMDCQVSCGDMPDVSALGAGMLAAMQDGIYTGLDEIRSLYKNRRLIAKSTYADEIDGFYKGWNTCLKGKN